MSSSKLMLVIGLALVVFLSFSNFSYSATTTTATSIPSTTYVTTVAPTLVGCDNTDSYETCWFWLCSGTNPRCGSGMFNNCTCASGTMSGCQVDSVQSHCSVIATTTISTTTTTATSIPSTTSVTTVAPTLVGCYNTDSYETCWNWLCSGTNPRCGTGTFVTCSCASGTVSGCQVDPVQTHCSVTATTTLQTTTTTALTTTIPTSITTTVAPTSVGCYNTDSYETCWNWLCSGTNPRCGTGTFVTCSCASGTVSGCQVDPVQTHCSTLASITNLVLTQNISSTKSTLLMTWSGGSSPYGILLYRGSSPSCASDGFLGSTTVPISQNSYTFDVPYSGPSSVNQYYCFKVIEYNNVNVTSGYSPTVYVSAPATTTGSTTSTTATTSVSTTVPAINACNAPLYLMYLRQNMTCGPFTVQLAALSQPNSSGISFAVINVYKNGGLLDTYSIMPQSHVSVLNGGAPYYIIYVGSTFAGLNSYQQWAQVSIQTPQTSLSTAPTLVIAPSSLTQTNSSLTVYQGGTTSTYAETSGSSVGFSNTSFGGQGTFSYNAQFYAGYGITGTLTHSGYVGSIQTWTLSFSASQTAIAGVYHPVIYALNSTSGQKTSVNLTLTVNPSTTTIPVRSPVPPCGSYGDLNNDGVVNATDASLVSDCIMGQSDCTPQMRTRADVNNDGIVNVLDLTLIERYAAGSVSTFPVCNPASTTTVPATTITSIATTSIPTTIFQYLTYTVTLNRGWNLFSVPLEYATKLNTTCASSAIASPIWQLVNGQYEQASSIYGGIGYWVKSNSECSVTFSGPALTIDELPSLSQGWNLIGAFSYPTAFRSIAGTCSATSLMGFNPNANSYYSVSVSSADNVTGLLPSNGYFVKVSAACKLGSASALPPPVPT
jgi:hypothetical protein